MKLKQLLEDNEPVRPDRFALSAMPFSTSFMKDRGEVLVDGTTYVHIRKDEWQAQSNQPHVIGAIINNKTLADIIHNANEVTVF